MIIVSGYYGFANLGDEAILAALCNDIVELGFKREEIVVPSGNPRETEATHGVKTLPRYDLAKIWQALGSARCLISGGGSLLQDVTSKRSIPYYLGLVELAFLRNVPVVMYGQGLGPVRNRVFRTWVGSSFQRSSACSVRDQGSRQFLLDLGIPIEKIQLCADPVFQTKIVLNQGFGSGRLLLNLRPYDLWQKQKDLWLENLSLWQEQGFRVEFVPLGPGDRDLGFDLQGKCPALEVHPDVTLAHYAQVLNGADLFLSMRLHGVILGALHDTLPLGLNYDPKVKAICAQLKTPCWEIGSAADLGLGIRSVLQDADQIRLNYHQALEGLRQDALGNRRMLGQVLG